MNYKDLLPKLREFDQIVITGPHRAGTTIATKIIAEDLGYLFCAEEGFGQHFTNLLACIQRSRSAKTSSVYQTPLLSAYAHLLPHNVAIVFMDRPVSEILASQKRIRWAFAAGQGNERRELDKYFRDTGTAAEVKYEVWEKYQKPKIRYAFDLDYHSLAEHPLWIDKSERSGFKPRQISKDREKP